MKLSLPILDTRTATTPDASGSTGPGPTSHGPIVVATAMAAEATCSRRGTAACSGRCSRPSVAAVIDHRTGRLAAARARAALGPDASVSIAHRFGRAVAAATHASNRVGIDLEPLDAVRSHERRYFLSHVERRAWGPHGPTLAWTVKEAVWKLLSLPKSEPFTALEVVPGRGAEEIEIHHGNRVVGARWWVLRPWPGWIGSVVWTPARPGGAVGR